MVKAFVALKGGFESERGAAQGVARPCAAAARAGGGAEGYCVSAELAEDAQWQDHATLLKARELGLPEGDISTLESEER